MKWNCFLCWSTCHQFMGQLVLDSYLNKFFCYSVSKLFILISMSSTWQYPWTGRVFLTFDITLNLHHSSHVVYHLIKVNTLRSLIRKQLDGRRLASPRRLFHLANSKNTTTSSVAMGFEVEFAIFNLHLVNPGSHQSKYKSRSVFS